MYVKRYEQYLAKKFYDKKVIKLFLNFSKTKFVNNII